MTCIIIIIADDSRQRKYYHGPGNVAVHKKPPPCSERHRVTFLCDASWLQVPAMTDPVLSCCQTAALTSTRVPVELPRCLWMHLHALAASKGAVTQAFGGCYVVLSII